MCAMDRVTPAGSEAGRRRPSALFDYDRSLARLGGDPRLFAEIVVLFLEDSPKLLEAARESIRQSNLPALERAAHSLKGLSVNFDAGQLASAAAAVEQSAHHRDGQRAQACFQDMERELGRLQASLNEFRRQNSSGERH